MLSWFENAINNCVSTSPECTDVVEALARLLLCADSELSLLAHAIKTAIKKTSSKCTYVLNGSCKGSGETANKCAFSSELSLLAHAVD